MSIFSDYFSLSSTNLHINSKLFCDSVFWRHLWCFNRVRGPLVTAPDLLLYVQYVLCFNTCLFCVHCTILASQLYMHLVTALRVDYPGGYLHRAPCTLQRAPTGLSPITDNQGVSHGKYEPLLLSSNVLSSPPLMLDLLLKYQFVPIAP